MKCGVGVSGRRCSLQSVSPPALPAQLRSPDRASGAGSGGSGEGALRGPVVRESAGLPIATGARDRRSRMATATGDGEATAAERQRRSPPAPGIAGRRPAPTLAGTRNPDHENTERANAGSHESRPHERRPGATNEESAEESAPTRRGSRAGETGRWDRRDRRETGTRQRGSGRAAGAATEPSRRDSGRTQGQRPRVERRTMRPLLFMTPTVLPRVTSFASSRSLSFATAMYTGPR